MLMQYADPLAEALQGNSDADGVLSIAARIAALLPP